VAFKIDEETRKLLIKLQRNEATDRLVYERLARVEKDEKNRDVLLRIAEDERAHEAIWESYTCETVKPDMFKVYLSGFFAILLGYTFIIKIMEGGEDAAVERYAQFRGMIPEIESIIGHEQRHEDELIGMLDEERLQYVGAIVLGLNDALVELTGTIAGLSLALANTRLIAMAGIVTGIAATLSMAASNYLAERSNNNPHALKASIYTGGAYLVTVVILVLPYLLLGEDMYLVALAIMLVLAVVVIFLFNLYLSVAKSLPFWKRFGQMAAISLGVAAISFVIGLAAKALLGVDV
jgi:VIT1/CCC1 family predicted Fe2+/Mn2+ transporter